MNFNAILTFYWSFLKDLKQITFNLITEQEFQLIFQSPFNVFMLYSSYVISLNKVSLSKMYFGSIHI